MHVPQPPGIPLLLPHRMGASFRISPIPPHLGQGRLAIAAPIVRLRPPSTGILPLRLRGQSKLPFLLRTPLRPFLTIPAKPPTHLVGIVPTHVLNRTIVPFEVARISDPIVETLSISALVGRCFDFERRILRLRHRRLPQPKAPLDHHVMRRLLVEKPGILLPHAALPHAKSASRYVTKAHVHPCRTKRPAGARRRVA